MAEPEVAGAVGGGDGHREEPAVVGVPVMAPGGGSMDRPAGRPVADQVRVAVDDVSVADGRHGGDGGAGEVDLVAGVGRPTPCW